MGDRGALEPGDEVMPFANNIGSVNGECVNGSTQDMIVQVVQNDFNFRKFRHKWLRGKEIDSASSGPL
jgi:hypothetical protein